MERKEKNYIFFLVSDVYNELEFSLSIDLGVPCVETI